MTTDIFDKRKERIETEMINQAEDRVLPAMLGKAAFEAYVKELRKSGVFTGMREKQWSEIDPDHQVSWVGIAQAAVKEARRVGIL